MHSLHIMELTGTYHGINRRVLGGDESSIRTSGDITKSKDNKTFNLFGLGYKLRDASSLALGDRRLIY